MAVPDFQSVMLPVLLFMKFKNPTMTVRDTVLFPGVKLPLMIGRPFTIAAIQDAIKNFDGHMVITTQKAIEMNDKPSLDQVFLTGCLCKIIDHMQFPDESMKIAVEGQSRFQISSLLDIGEGRHCEGEKLAPPTGDGNIDSTRKNFILENILTRLGTVGDDTRAAKYIEFAKKQETTSSFLMSVAALLCQSKIAQRNLTLEQIKQGVFLLDTYTNEDKAAINTGLARIVEILSENDTERALKKVEALLNRKLEANAIHVQERRYRKVGRDLSLHLKSGNRSVSAWAQNS